MCDCLEKMNAALKKRYGRYVASDSSHPDGKIFPRLDVRTARGGPSRGRVLASHCPFCGTLIDAKCEAANRRAMEQT